MDEEELNKKNYDYYQQYIKLIPINEQLKTQFEEIEKLHKELKSKIDKDLLNDSGIQNSDLLNNLNYDYIKRKRMRRKKNNINLNFNCQICNKPYGSESSKNQHIRLKHPKIENN